MRAPLSHPEQLSLESYILNRDELLIASAVCVQDIRKETYPKQEIMPAKKRAVEVDQTAGTPKRAKPSKKEKEALERDEDLALELQTEEMDDALARGMEAELAAVEVVPTALKTETDDSPQTTGTEPAGPATPESPQALSDPGTKQQPAVDDPNYTCPGPPPRPHRSTGKV